MNINGVQKNSHIPSQATQKSNSVEGSSFKEILDSTRAKETSLEEIFKNASQTYGVPIQLLKAVGKVESNFNPNAVSSSGASGIMQLMPATARGLGVTDVFDAEQNINGGAKYLSQLLKRYDGDLSLTLAGYNAGPGNVAKYGGVPNFKETKNYITKVEQALNDDGQDIKLTNYQDTVEFEATKTLQIPILNNPEAIAKLLQLKLLEDFYYNPEEDSEEQV